MQRLGAATKFNDWSSKRQSLESKDAACMRFAQTYDSQNLQDIRSGMKANTATTTNMSRVLLQVQISQKTLEEKLNDEWARLRYEGKQSAS